MKRFLLLFTYIIILIFTFSPVAFAGNYITQQDIDEGMEFCEQYPVKLTLDGKEIVFEAGDIPPLIVKERTLIPARALFESMGGAVDWDEEKQEVKITFEDSLVVLTIGSNQAWVNGTARILEVPAMIIARKGENYGRTMIPVRFTAEALGCKVDWNDPKREVVIFSPLASGNEEIEAPASEPKFSTGRLSLAQGEIFVMKLTNVPSDIKPVAKTDLGLSIFTPTVNGEWFAAIPVGNTRQPGKYKVTVNAGTFGWETEVSVNAYAFSTQNLTVDTSNTAIVEANSPAAYQQYREKIPPLFETYDEQVYWEGPFVWPVSGGRISTQFGVIRYTNSNWSNPRYHWGIDIAANKGVPVNAPNHGRVVLAEYLLNTGNTVVIEHGGGLKSYYYHMDSLDISVGDTVQKWGRIGAVGSTGYSTGPHLHFEMRIGDQAVNPIKLFEGSASLYSF